MRKLWVIVIAITLITILLAVMLTPEAASQQEKSPVTSGYYNDLFVKGSTQVPKQPKTPVKTQSVQSVYDYDEGSVKDYAYKRVCEVWGCEYWGEFNLLISSESGWNPCAYNPGKSDCNLTAEEVNATQTSNSVACGLGQQKPCGKWAGDWRDPYIAVDNIVQYILHRPDYGNPQRAWYLWSIRNPHWY